MKKINNDVYLEVVKKSINYEIYVNGNKIDCFKKDMIIQNGTLKWLNSLLCLDFNKDELQTHLIENYLVKDVEDMTNEEFAEYLVENVDGLYIGGSCVNKEYANGISTYIHYKGSPVYRIISDEINFNSWNGGTLFNKFSFCKFNSVGNVQSKGNRKKFVNIVKQTIEYLDNFKIKEEEDSE